MLKLGTLSFLVLIPTVGLTVDIELPGEAMTNAPISCAPFPDRLSAYVWRNWFVVPKARLAKTVGASTRELTDIATEMGLPADPEVRSEWQRKGYITILRRNWHLLDYPQLMALLDVSREKLRYSLCEDDFLFIKFGNLKPKCGPLRFDAKTVQSGRAARQALAKDLRRENAANFTEEPRFQFMDDFRTVSDRPVTGAASNPDCPFNFRMVYPYFAEYGDPLFEEDLKSCPEGLFARLSEQGVNAVWLHVVLSTLATDSRYPEFGDGSERRIANLKKLVARAAKHGVKIFLYLNEPRSQPAAFFSKPGREELRGVAHSCNGTYAMCTTPPETRRWLRDSLAQVFRAVPGLGGVFTITMSENLTNCTSHNGKAKCTHCRDRRNADILAEVNAAIAEGVHAGNPDAQVIYWDWNWNPPEEMDDLVSRLPKRNAMVMAVSEREIPFVRGGVKDHVIDYSISVVGPGEKSRGFWSLGRRHGLGVAAKVQSNCTWEMSPFPYLPVMDLVAEHALNLKNEGVEALMLSWSLGGYPSPNQRIFRDIRKGDRTIDPVLNRIATDLYGEKAVPGARAAWTAFSEGYREYPFSVAVAYYGPQHWGVANPLYWESTGYVATMVGIPYDDLKKWRGPYPAKTWIDQMEKVHRGFEKGCRLFADQVVAVAEGDRQAFARKELGLFRGECLHFASIVDQGRFVLARERQDRTAMREIAHRELGRAREMLVLDRADSRIGFEGSCHYFYTPQDLREKVLNCLDIIRRLEANP